MERCQITVPTDKHPRKITSVPAVLAGSQWLKALGFSSKLLVGSENLVFIFKSHLFSFHTADILSDSRYLPFLFQWLLCGRKKGKGRKKRNRLIPNVMAAIKLQEVILLINLCETKQQYQKSNKRFK